jgi:LacI family transcriptional regulator, gluconate utilization system Gnt-I transcriptional repressor
VDGSTDGEGAGAENPHLGLATVPPVNPTPRRPRRRSATRSVTLADVATAAGVSPQTVSRALRDREAVAVETYERVEQAVAATGYVPNLAASNLASNRSRAVAAIIPQMNASVFAETVHTSSETLTPHGYQIFVGSTEYRPDQEEQLVRSFLGRRPDGLLVVGTEHTPGTRALLSTAAIPVVETWGWTDDPVDLLIGFSNAAAAAELVRHLVGRGRRRPVFAGALQAGDFRAAERRDGFAAAVRELLAVEPLIVSADDLSVSMDTGVALLDRALARYPDTDAVVFASDVFAAGALLACTRRGIPVPERLAITGFGDFEVSAHLVPSLTTVAVPTEEIGTLAGTLLLDRMHGRAVSEPVRDVGFRLVQRESS